ncbi:uncharacterized protein LOC123564083 [Mercenaria mercenaria]|uniref:uncharacterized protein LOC123564083 n=1 Tax=Mercenaria mercenaria TaxID=6596 RepID=UPI00234E8D0F|nr:uncharacterized protein LOC123564083 [Mercenaria mercenaria]
MAAVKKIEVSGEIFCDNVLNKPPLPGRPVSGKFHNRGSGKLFPSTQHNKLFTDTQQDSKPEVAINHLALVLHPDSKLDDDTSQPSTPKSVPSYCRRTQSAKARCQNVRKNSAQKSHRQRPVSAGSRMTQDKNGMCSSKPAVIDLANKVIPDLFEIEKQKILALPDPRDYGQNVYQNMPPMHFSRPSSAKYSDTDVDSSHFCKKGIGSKSVRNGLKPSVYGLQRQRQFYGSAPDLSSTNCNFDQYPYKISQTREDTNVEYVAQNRDIPHTLEPLLPWLQDDVPEEVLGVNPAHCLVFLAPTDWSELPELPEPQAPEEDLPFIQDITTPKPWNPKKYPYYSSKQPVDDWVCKHGSQVPASDSDDTRTIYRQTFRIPRMRTADIVKKEITDLENLLKGIGNKDSDCSMANYQSEIINFQNLLNDTLEMVPDR